MHHIVCCTRVYTYLHFVTRISVYSVGRDKIINVWDIKEGKSKKTVPVFEVYRIVILYCALYRRCVCSL